MLRIDILSVVPRLIESTFQYSIVRRAQDKGLVEVHLHDLHAFSPLPHRRVDDYPYGGEPGMVLSIVPIAAAIRTLQAARSYDEIIYFNPRAPVWTQAMANRYALQKNLLLLCGHYKGIDDRVRKLLITKEISLGTFVLSGGELVASVFVDSIVRLLPGALGDSAAALSDSFQNGAVGAPVYTRPAVFEGLSVPPVLLSGNHRAIEAWRETAIEEVDHV